MTELGIDSMVNITQRMHVSPCIYHNNWVFISGIKIADESDYFAFNLNSRSLFVVFIRVFAVVVDIDLHDINSSSITPTIAPPVPVTFGFLSGGNVARYYSENRLA